MPSPWMKQLDRPHSNQTQQGVDGLGIASQMPTRLAEHNLGGVSGPQTAEGITILQEDRCEISRYRKRQLRLNS